MSVRDQISVRLLAEDKEFFTACAADAGLEAGTAARQLVELVIVCMRTTGQDYIDALKRVKDALK